MSANHRHETLSEMVAQGRNLAVTCDCGRRGVLPGGQLVRLFFLRRWNGRKHMIRDHLRCSVCGSRPNGLGPTHAAPTGPWHGPADEASWRKLARRLRG